MNNERPSRATEEIPEQRRQQALPRLRPLRVSPDRLALRVPIQVSVTAEVSFDGAQLCAAAAMSASSPIATRHSIRVTSQRARCLARRDQPTRRGILRGGGPAVRIEKNTMTKRKNDFLAEQQERYKWLRRVTDDAIAARTKEVEFHGLEEELRNLQRAILDSYNRTTPIKHPRDKGDHREEILRHFLTNHGLLPNSINVPSVSTRVVSPSGHISPELDILFVNASDSIILKKYEDTLEYYPVESVLGTIQVKSKLTKKELVSGLKHIQAFKNIRPIRSLKSQMGGFTLEAGIYRRFGILFAYERALRWEIMVDIIRDHIAECPNSLWPNMIVVLDAGYFLIGDKSRYGWNQRTLEDISNPEVLWFSGPILDIVCNNSIPI